MVLYSKNMSGTFHERAEYKVPNVVVDSSVTKYELAVTWIERGRTN